MRTGSKRMPPEVDSGGVAGGIRLHARTVHRNDRQAIGHAVAALDQLPGLTLLRLLPVRVRRHATDSCRINEQFRPVQGHGAGRFRIPLVPAHQHAQRTHRRFDGPEAQVSGREIELLIEERIVRDVHLAVGAGNAAVRLQDHGGIVINAGRTALKQRKHQHNAQFLGQLAVGLRGRPGDGLRQVAQLGVFLLAEVQTVVQFLQHHQLGTLRSGFTDVLLQTGHILGDMGGARLLHHAYLQFSHYLYRLNCLNSLSALILSMIAHTRRKVRESLV